MNNAPGRFHFILLLVLLKITLSARAQSVDSLEALLKKTNGLERINLQLQLADAYASEDWQKSVAHASQGLALANEYRHDSLRFEANFVLPKVTSALATMNKRFCMGRMPWRLLFDSRSRAASIHHLGRIYESRSEYQKALEMFLQAIEIHKSIDNKKGLANTLNSLAFVYKGMDQYEKALQMLAEAKALYETIGNESRVASVTFNMGLMIMEMDKHAEAIPYFKRQWA